MMLVMFPYASTGFLTLRGVGSGTTRGGGPQRRLDSGSLRRGERATQPQSPGPAGTFLERDHGQAMMTVRAR